MSFGCINHLRTSLLKNRIRPRDVFDLFHKRIQADKQAFESQLSLSSLGLTPTNSILDSLSAENISETSQFRNLFLHSIPIVVKDNFSVDYNKHQLGTTCASISLETFKSSYDASVVTSLLDSGVFIMGKSNMDEFAMGCGSTDGKTNGPVINPWSCKYISDKRDNVFSVRLIAGGSSGGSAASVASGLCLAALASDTGGSARLPAAYCGVVGYKPTYGLVSRRGLIPLANSLDVPAIITPTVSDLANILSSWLSPKNGSARSGDSTCLPISDSKLDEMYSGLIQLATLDLGCDSKAKSVRIGIPVEYHVPGLDSEIGAMWDKVAGWLADDWDCSVELIRLPHTPIATSVYSIICAAEVASNMSRYDGLRYGYSVRDNDYNSEDIESSLGITRTQCFGNVVRSRILAGNYFLLGNQQNPHLVAARKLWRLIKEDFDKVFQSIDFILTPVTPGLSPTLEEFTKLDNRTQTTLDDVCTVAVNLAGLPAVSFPAGISSTRGLPIGLQLIGPHFSDSNLIGLAMQLENRANFLPLVDTCKIIDSI